MDELIFDKSSIKSNSHKSKSQSLSADENNERDRLSPVVKQGGIVTTKKPLYQKFADFFMPNDVDDIKDYIIMDIIIPGIKDTFLDIIEMSFYGTTDRKRKSRSRNDDRTDYKSYYGNSSSKKDRRRDRSRSRRDDKVDYRHIVLKYRDETEDVIEEMRRRIRKEGGASIADLLDLIGEQEIGYNDNNWGWTDENDIRLRRVSGGFLIDVCEAEYLD